MVKICMLPMQDVNNGVKERGIYGVCLYFLLSVSANLKLFYGKKKKEILGKGKTKSCKEVESGKKHCLWIQSLRLGLLYLPRIFSLSWIITAHISYVCLITLFNRTDHVYRVLRTDAGKSFINVDYHRYHHHYCYWGCHRTAQ